MHLKHFRILLSKKPAWLTKICLAFATAISLDTIAKHTAMPCEGKKR